MEKLTRITRIATGIVFVFSGLVKGIDPLGTAYKLGDYFSAFKIGFLDDLTLPLSILLCTVEFLAGLLLISGAFTRLASWTVALFMALFTPLTLVLAITNPVSDCGCFGDAIHLTNWQTFFKNIILTLMVVFVFIRRDDRTRTMNHRSSVVATASYLVLFLLFVWYNLSYLPLIDFRPYSTGTNIPEAMALPADAPADKYDIRFIYEKEGVQKEFTLSDYPANDTSWHFVDQKSVLISQGYRPPVHDFYLVTDDGVDMTEDILNDPGYTILMIARKLDKANPKGINRGLNLGLAAQRQNTGFFVVTASPSPEARIAAAGFNHLFADETTLKTVIRANPGFLLLHNGTVMAKWSHRDIPDKEELNGDLTALSFTQIIHRNTMLTVMCLLFVLSVIYILTLPFRSDEGKTLNA